MGKITETDIKEASRDGMNLEKEAAAKELGLDLATVDQDAVDARWEELDTEAATNRMADTIAEGLGIEPHLYKAIIQEATDDVAARVGRQTATLTDPFDQVRVMQQTIAASISHTLIIGIQAERRRRFREEAGE